MLTRNPALGIALPHGTLAGSDVVSPVQTSTYLLGAYNPITFGAATQINALSNVGVYGGSGQSWTVANYGRIQGQLDGIHLLSSGSTVTNWGTIIGSGASIGVLLENGGSVANQSSGSISGYAGVAIGGTGTVTNAGSISAGVTAIYVASGSVDNELGGTLSMTTSGLSTLTVYVGGGGTVTNAGTITNAGYNTSAVAIGGGGRVTNSGRIFADGVLDSAVYTLNGGTVTNSGTLLVSAATSAGVIFLDGGALDNTGTIEATGGGSEGVCLVNGGTITNSSTIAATATSGIGVGSEFAGTVDNQSGGTISGAVAGVLIGSGTGSVTNSGEIRATTAGFGVNLVGGGGVANQSGGTITGGDSGVYFAGGSATTNLVTNTGTISGTGTNSTGLNLASGGAVTNQSGGTVSGVAHGVFLAGGTSLLSNAGNIYGTAASGSGAVLDAGGSVTNTGKISGGALGVYTVGAAAAATNSGSITGASLGGAAFFSGGSVTDQSGGTISGANFGVFISGGSGTANGVTNAGNITGAGTNSVGVLLGSGGAVTNQIGGAINGGAHGVYVTGGAGTVTNAGIIAGKAASVVFAGPGANTLTLETGSTLNGGAYGSTASGATNALILQGHGTASNNFGNFNTLTADASGVWALTGNSSFGDTTISTGTLSVSGSLTSATLEIQASANLTDTGDVSVQEKNNSVYLGGTLGQSGGELLIGGDLSGSGSVTIGNSGVVDIGGSASSLAKVIFNDGDNDVLRLRDPLGFESAISGFQSGDSIDLANTLANAFTYSNGLLNVTENGVAVAKLQFSGQYTQSQFSIATDGHGGALLTANTG